MGYVLPNTKPGTLKNPTGRNQPTDEHLNVHSLGFKMGTGIQLWYVLFSAVAGFMCAFYYEMLHISPSTASKVALIGIQIPLFHVDFAHWSKFMAL